MIAPFHYVQGEFMPIVLAFGDSNTWGSIPGQGAHGAGGRWPGVMARMLGTSFD
jgi:lysophospholipase L1-like esterase